MLNPVRSPGTQDGASDKDRLQLVPVKQAVDPLILEGGAVWGHTPQIQNVSAQTNLYMQGSAADEAYLVLRGKFSQHSDNALRRLRLGIHGRGTWLAIGELLHGRPYACTAIAIEPSSVVVVTKPILDRFFSKSSPTLFRAISGSTWQALGLQNALESQSMEQTFLGICRGLELILGQSGGMPESQLTTRLKELFGLSTDSVQESLKLLESLNLLVRTQQSGKEAILRLNDSDGFGERVRVFSEQFRGKLPHLFGNDAHRESMSLEAVCETLNVKPAQFLRRMLLPDFPQGLLRFDPDAIASVRVTHGDAFFRKKLGSREMLSQIEAIDELIDVEPPLLRNILPAMEVSKLIRLMAGLDSVLRNHLLQGLSSRVRRTVEEEVPHIGEVGAQEMGDLEEELISLCRTHVP